MEVVVLAQREGLHCWPEAFGEVSFLKSPHRHVFHIEVRVEITKSRQVEFFLFRKDLAGVLDSIFLTSSTNAIADLGDQSCEDIARKILLSYQGATYNVKSVSVFEDGENGAVVSQEDIIRDSQSEPIQMTVDGPPAIFYGQEAEAFSSYDDYFNVSTLFVPGRTLLRDFYRSVGWMVGNSNTKYLRHIYFGAGEDNDDFNCALLAVLLRMMNEEHQLINKQMSWEMTRDFFIHLPDWFESIRDISPETASIKTLIMKNLNRIRVLIVHKDLQSYNEATKETRPSMISPFLTSPKVMIMNKVVHDGKILLQNYRGDRLEVPTSHKFFNEDLEVPKDLSSTQGVPKR